MKIDLEKITKERDKFIKLLERNSSKLPQGISGAYRGRIEVYNGILNNEYKLN